MKTGHFFIFLALSTQFFRSVRGGASVYLWFDPVWNREQPFFSSLAMFTIFYYIASYYSKVAKLPAGPPCFPYQGCNADIGSGRLYEKVLPWCAKYSDPLTVWVGSKPIVIASTNNSFKDISGSCKKHLGGRLECNLRDVISRGHTDLFFSDFTATREILRRLLNIAAKGYAKTEKLAETCSRVVDNTLDNVVGDTPQTSLCIVSYVDMVINDLTGESTFGSGFKKEDPMHEKLRQSITSLSKELGSMPLSNWIYTDLEKRTREAIQAVQSVTDFMFKKAADTYEKGSSRHFTDYLLAAREQLIKENDGNRWLLRDGSLRQIVFDLFFAEAKTTRPQVTYCLLRLANNNELQKKLRQEILEAVGDRSANFDDRKMLPLTGSFIKEVFRLYPALPLGFPTKTLSDITLYNKTIPKGTAFMTNQYAWNRDKEIWGEDAQEFRADRFVSTSEYHQAFGMGSRSCPGESMADDIFYCIVRTLQKVEVSCPRGEGTADFTAGTSHLFMEPKKQLIIFKRIN